MKSPCFQPDRTCEVHRLLPETAERWVTDAKLRVKNDAWWLYVYEEQVHKVLFSKADIINGYWPMDQMKTSAGRLTTEVSSGIPATTSGGKY